jgi:hypothetical protein
MIREVWKAAEVYELDLTGRRGRKRPVDKSIGSGMSGGRTAEVYELDEGREEDRFGDEEDAGAKRAFSSEKEVGERNQYE